MYYTTSYYLFFGFILKHYKIKKFKSEAKKVSLADESLIETLNNFLKMDREGQQKYSLGAGLYKLRLSTMEGRGKSAGSRSILAFKQDNRVVWIHLFSKNEKANVSTDELKKLKTLSDVLLALSESDMENLIELGELFEVKEDD